MSAQYLLSPISQTLLNPFWSGFPLQNSFKTALFWSPRNLKINSQSSPYLTYQWQYIVDHFFLFENALLGTWWDTLTVLLLTHWLLLFSLLLVPSYLPSPLNTGVTQTHSLDIFFHILNPLVIWFSLSSNYISVLFSSVAESFSNSLQLYGLQHARPLCPSTTPRVYSNSCPLSWWCHPAISSSAVPFSSCPQSFSASGSFPMSQVFASGGQSVEVLASTSVLPMNTQDWSPLGWTGWTSLHQGTLKSLLQHHNSKASFLQCSAFFTVQLSHPYVTTGKTIALIRWTFIGKVMSLLFHMLSRLV